MKRNHLIAGAATIAVLAGGGAAVAATSDRKAQESAVLADAAKRLGVSSSELRSALADAEDSQLDAAVKAGTLTQAQADQIKQHRKADGTVLNVGPGGGHGPGGWGGRGGPGAAFGVVGPRELLADAAKAIGISQSSLEGQLRDGKSIESIAKAKGKSLADVKASVKSAETARLDAAVKAKTITQAQRDEITSHLDDFLDRIGDGSFGRGGHRWSGNPPSAPTPGATPSATPSATP